MRNELIAIVSKLFDEGRIQHFLGYGKGTVKFKTTPLIARNREDLREAARLLNADLAGAASLLASMERTVQGVDRTLGHVDRNLLNNSDALEETLANLRRSSQNLRELSQSLKERPWSAILPADTPEKPGMDPRPARERRK
jgi:hypothetical protein